MGAIHESNGQSKNSYNGATPTTYLNRSFGIHPAFTDAPRVECGNTPAGMATFLDHLSPTSLVSPGTDCSRSSRESRSPSIALLRRSGASSSLSDRSVPKDDAMSEAGSDGTIPDDKDSESGKINSTIGFYRENSKTDSEQKLRIRSRSRSRSRSTERRLSDIGSSRESLKLERCSSVSIDSDKGKDDNRRDSGIGDSKENLNMDSADDSSREVALEISGNHLTTSTPYTDKERSSESNGDVMDLSSGPSTPPHNTEDLALSPPSSYTAQVRDVIRQRILAGKTNSSAFDPVVRDGEHSDVKIENDANNNEPDATPKMLKHLGLQPKRLERQISGDYGNQPRERPLSTPPEPLSLVMNNQDLRSLPRSTSLMSPMLGGENTMARSLAIQMGIHPSPLAVMASHNLNFLHHASALMDGKSPYTLPVPPLLRPGSTPNSRGLSPVGMYPSPPHYPPQAASETAQVPPRTLT